MENQKLSVDRDASKSLLPSEGPVAKKQKLATFPILPNTRFGTKIAPTLRRPLFIGDFSLDGERNFHHDKRNLSFITIDWGPEGKQVKYDLNVAMDKVRRKDYKQCSAERLKHLLTWILLNRYKFALSPAPPPPPNGDRSRLPPGNVQPSSCITSLSTDFVCFRGLLRDLMCSPYQREGWIVLATKFRRTIYLCAIDSVEKQMEKEKQDESQKKMCSWGYKFEQYMRNDSDPNEGNNESEEYCCILRSRLASHSMVYGAEVDGADPTQYKTPLAHLTPFVELKTNREIQSERHKNILHKFKFQKWWSQSFLVGIPRVIVGFRDEGGIVRSVQTFTVSSMPSESQNYWSTDVMINFLDQFLTWVKSQVVEDNPYLVYQFTRPPGSPDVQCLCLGENSSAVAFLPEWYVNEIFSEGDEQALHDI